MAFLWMKEGNMSELPGFRLIMIDYECGAVRVVLVIGSKTNVNCWWKKARKRREREETQKSYKSEDEKDENNFS